MATVVVGSNGDRLQVTDLLERLTAREREVVIQVLSGGSYREIAHELGIRPKTVGKHLERVFLKFEIHSRAELAALFRSEGEIG